MNDSILSKEDYEEPICPLCRPRDATPIPVGRVIEKLDEYLNRNDYGAAEKHLQYWLAEAEAGGDARGRLAVLNEQIGLSRKLGRAAEALCAAEAALEQAESLGMGGTVTMGTTLVNAATAYKAFGHAEAALPLYERAQAIYEESLPPGDARLGGLYNNMALALTDLGNYRKAKALYEKALGVMAQQPDGAAEQAITWCNLADLAAAEQGLEAAEARIGDCLDRAFALLDTPGLPRSGYYAFVCEKCAPTFGYYGWFAAEQELQRRTKEIYERT